MLSDGALLGFDGMGIRTVSKPCAVLNLGKEAQTKLRELFLYGHVEQACKIIGMRHARAWSTD